MRLPSGEIAVWIGGPSMWWLTEFVSPGGSIVLSTVPFWVMRMISS
jgi:hypothetical protein